MRHLERDDPAARVSTEQIRAAGSNAAYLFQIRLCHLFHGGERALSLNSASLECVNGLVLSQTERDVPEVQNVSARAMNAEEWKTTVPGLDEHQG